MKRRIWITALSALAIALLSTRAGAAAPNPLRLVLPPVFYAVPGVEMAVYYDNIVLTETPEDYRFTIACDIGKAEDRRWAVTPERAHVGDHEFTVAVADASGRPLGQARTTLRVVPARAGAERKIKLMIIGDSLTHATVYPNEIARLLSEPGNPKWRMLGTHKGRGAKEGVIHEGYGGWTWSRFATKYEPNPDGTYKKRSSPFVFLGDDGKPVLDPARYFDENFEGERPDFITILLGINDCFGAKPESPETINPRVDTMLGFAKTLLDALRKAAPAAEIGICITTPPNARESGFQANYKGKYPRWGWKRIQHRLVERGLKHFGNREAEGLHLVPTQLNVDPVDGYPVNNGVHPNTVGYKQVGAGIYAWLKARLHAAEATEE